MKFFFIIEHRHHIERTQQKTSISGLLRSKPTKRVEIFLTPTKESQEYVAATMAASQIKMEEQTKKKKKPSTIITCGRHSMTKFQEFFNASTKEKIGKGKRKMQNTNLLKSFLPMWSN